MKKVILFGASGNIGSAIAKELAKKNYDLSVVVRSQEKAGIFSAITRKYIIADVSNPGSLPGICNGQDIVISALGKSVSPNDKAKASFRQVDLEGNRRILTQAKQAGIEKFVYVSALHAERYDQLEYFKVHTEFSDELVNSGIDYSIIKPPAVFCAFKDLIEMARKGRLVNIGPGDRRTNPIFEGDLAAICVASIAERNRTIEAGGKTIYTRKQLNEIIQQETNPAKKIRTIPIGLVKTGLPFLKLFNRNLFDKISFFVEVMQHDTIAPQLGEKSFVEYIRESSRTG